jgi:hypothetical protein
MSVSLTQDTRYSEGILHDLEVALGQLRAAGISATSRRSKQLADDIATMGSRLILSTHDSKGYVARYHGLKHCPDFLAAMHLEWITALLDALEAGHTPDYCMFVARLRVESRAVNYWKRERNQFKTVSISPSANEAPETHEPSAPIQSELLAVDEELEDGQEVLQKAWSVAQHELSDTARDIVEYTTGIDGGVPLSDSECAAVLNAVEGKTYTANAVKKSRHRSLKRLKTSPNAALLASALASREDVHSSSVGAVHLRLDPPFITCAPVPPEVVLPITSRAMSSADRNRMYATLPQPIGMPPGLRNLH